MLDFHVLDFRLELALTLNSTYRFCGHRRDATIGPDVLFSGPGETFVGAINPDMATGPHERGEIM
jgi:hypothetical protein